MQISGSIRIRMSAGWLPKCCGFITLSSATVTPTSIVKIHPWVYAKCWNWSELPHSAIMVRKVEKWFRIHVWDKSPPRALILYRRRRFINHLLTYLLTKVYQFFWWAGPIITPWFNEIGSSDIQTTVYFIINWKQWSTYTSCITKLGITKSKI